MSECHARSDILFFAGIFTDDLSVKNDIYPFFNIFKINIL